MRTTTLPVWASLYGTARPEDSRLAAQITWASLLRAGTALMVFMNTRVPLQTPSISLLPMMRTPTSNCCTADITIAAVPAAAHSGCRMACASSNPSKCCTDPAGCSGYGGMCGPKCTQEAVKGCKDTCGNGYSSQGGACLTSFTSSSSASKACSTKSATFGGRPLPA